jgi:beta-1,4-mannosyl-glycoprotein beta-1,4-N-acetylglucosaminyltransferase
MVFDCVIFYNELDLLRLRIEFLYNIVDKFIIVEAAEGFTRKPKPLYFQQNKEKFKEFEEKIIYCVIEHYPFEDAWDNEFYSRNYFHNILKESATDNDLIILSDVDEIINLKEVMENFSISKPHFVEMYCYYYFLNLQSQEIINIPLISPYGYIRNKHWGHRYNMRDELDHEVISCKKINTGGHFTYQYGMQIDAYTNKLSNFSHQEYNKLYYLDPKRLTYCLTYAYDIFNRDFTYQVIEPEHVFDQEFSKLLHKLGLYSMLIYNTPKGPKKLKKYFSKYFYNRLFIIGKRKLSSSMPWLLKLREMFFN